MAEFMFTCPICLQTIQGEGRNVREVKALHLMREHDKDEVEKLYHAVHIIENGEVL